MDNPVYQNIHNPIYESTENSHYQQIERSIGTPLNYQRYNNSVYQRVSKSAGRIAGKYETRPPESIMEKERWWSVGETIYPAITSKDIGLSTNTSTSSFPYSDNDWDVSDSLQDLYHRVNNQSKFASSSFRRNNNNTKVDTKSWFEADNSHGFIRVFPSDSMTRSDRESQLIPCNVTTTAERICSQRGMPPNSLHAQMNGDTIKRLESYHCPLAIQNDYLMKIGYCDVHRIQEVGGTEEMSYLVRFHAGQPLYDGTYSRNELASFLFVRKGKFLHQWVKRLCTICGTRLSIYREKNSAGKALEVQLAKGSVEEVTAKGHRYTLKLTSTIQGERSVYLAFPDESEYSRWLKKAKKATSKLPTRADLSYCHLEMLPDTLFINDGLLSLNLRHNALRERPLDEDVYMLGWLDDLPRFFNLTSINLCDNDLKQFPRCLCHMTTLVDINLSGNKIDDVPTEISQLVNLQAMYLHNNHLSYLPECIGNLQGLSLLVLSFNHFTSIPQCLLSARGRSGVASPITSLVMAANSIQTISPETLQQMRHLHKIDLRMNHVCLLPREMVKLCSLDLVTHLDLRDNLIQNLDIRGMKKLEMAYCDRCGMRSAQLSGVSLKHLSAASNNLEEFHITPKPEWLISINLSNNRLKKLPDWLKNCFFLVDINVSHNALVNLPEGLLDGCAKLKVLHADHNSLETLGEVGANMNIEELYCQQNSISALPPNFLVHANRLRILNLSHNYLKSLPPINDNDTLNKIQELYLTANQITSDSMPRICGYSRLKVLHLAYNCLQHLENDDMSKLELLQELSVSGNHITELPSCLTHHPKLTVLRANANNIDYLPDFRGSQHLKVLEMSSNQLRSVSMSSLKSSQINLLDISDNPSLQVEKQDLEGIQEHKRILSVDMSGKDRVFQDLLQEESSRRQTSLSDSSLDVPWTAGFSQTSGIRNKLSVGVLSKATFTDNDDALFCLFDGGRNDEITKLLHSTLPDVMREELAHPHTKRDYMKYTVLSCHMKLRAVGQKLGASLGLCHVTRSRDNRGECRLNVANVGDVGIVVCRHGNSHALSRSFLVTHDRDDCERILQSDGVITENGLVNGISSKTRLIGSMYLYPHIIPDPHVTAIQLHHDDEFMIMANHGLWAFLSHQEAVDEIRDIHQPVAAAKKLQDLAQAYGSRENIAVLVVRFEINSPDRSSVASSYSDVFLRGSESREIGQRHLDRSRVNSYAVFENTNHSNEDDEKIEFASANDLISVNVGDDKGASKLNLISGIKDSNMSGAIGGNESETDTKQKEFGYVMNKMTGFSNFNEILQLSEQDSPYASCTSISTNCSEFQPVNVGDYDLMTKRDSSSVDDSSKIDSTVEGAVITGHHTQNSEKASAADAVNINNPSEQRTQKSSEESKIGSAFDFLNVQTKSSSNSADVGLSTTSVRSESSSNPSDTSSDESDSFDFASSKTNSVLFSQYPDTVGGSRTDGSFIMPNWNVPDAPNSATSGDQRNLTDTKSSSKDDPCIASPITHNQTVSEQSHAEGVLKGGDIPWRESTSIEHSSDAATNSDVLPSNESLAVDEDVVSENKTNDLHAKYASTFKQYPDSSASSTLKKAPYKPPHMVNAAETSCDGETPGFMLRYVDRDAVLFHKMQQMTMVTPGMSLGSVKFVPPESENAFSLTSHSIEVVVQPDELYLV